MNPSLMLIGVLSCFCWIGLTQAGVIDRELATLNANEAAINLTKKCELEKLKIEPEVLIDRDAGEKFIRRAKCSISCLLKSTELITEDNKLNKENIEKIHLNDAARGYFVFTCSGEEFYEKCSYIEDADSCDYAYKVMDCFNSVCKEAKK